MGNEEHSLAKSHIIMNDKTIIDIIRKVNTKTKYLGYVCTIARLCKCYPCQNYRDQHMNQKTISILFGN